jgi:murein tripeptide amidase MpaA
MKEMAQAPHGFNARDDPNTFPLNVYHTHAEINAWLQSVQTTYSSFVSLINLGKSYEQRDILCVKIGTPSTSSPKNSLFIDAGIHAREWIAPSTAIYTISNLVNGYMTTYKQLLDAIDIIVCPSVNPDGYEYSRLHNRMWRKTRTGPRQGCYGTDPNRNWPFHWGGEGTSSSPCSDIYTGPSALSEPSCMALSQYLQANKDTIKGYLTMHSYGQDFLVPYGYSVPTVYPPDYNELLALANQMASVLQGVHGTRYTVENSASLYAAAGASDDWSKSIGIKWVYTIELRDTGNNGFTLPASQIIPTGEETLPAVIVMATRIMTGPN